MSVLPDLYYGYHLRLWCVLYQANRVADSQVQYILEIRLRVF